MYLFIYFIIKGSAVLNIISYIIDYMGQYEVISLTLSCRTRRVPTQLMRMLRRAQQRDPRLSAEAFTAVSRSELSCLMF